jgi:rod shape-determining protein MreC
MKKYNKFIIITIIISGLAIILTILGVTTKLLGILPNISLESSILKNKDQSSSEQLQARIVALEAEVASLLYLKSENDLLKSTIQTKNDVAIIPIQAKIITFDNDFTRSSALVEVGSKDGVQVNQPVIYLGHLVGKVKEVSENSSKIQFLNDSEIKLAVSIQNSDFSQGILQSQFGTRLEVDSVSKLEKVNAGTNVVTKATEKIPSGLLIGKIESVSEGDLFHKIIIDYPIDFYKLTEVFILKT